MYAILVFTFLLLIFYTLLYLYVCESYISFFSFYIVFICCNFLVCHVLCSPRIEMLKNNLVLIPGDVNLSRDVYREVELPGILSLFFTLGLILQ